MTIRHHHQEIRPRQNRTRGIDLVSLVVLFLAVVAIAIGLVGIGLRGTEPWILIPPMLLGCFAILGLHR